MDDANNRQKLIAFAFSAVLVLALAPAFEDAFADGLTSETFTASVGNRDARLSVQINPPVLTSETQQDAFMQFRLFDANTNQTIQYATFYIAISKGADPDAPIILQDFFHTESGLLTLKIEPQEGEAVALGTREGILEALVADPSGTINIRGPLLLDGGLYHFRIEIFGIDSIKNIFAPDDAPKFDSWLSVGDVFNQDVQYQGQTHNMTIISYYDEVEEFNFNAESQTFTWQMPFDWNTSRIEEVPGFFVHEEVQIPKAMAGIGDAAYFNAVANDTPLTGAMLVVDPYTSETDLTLHYLLDKNDVLAIADKVPEGAEAMTFSLTPSENPIVQTTGEMLTDTGGIEVFTEWTPNQLSADAASTLKITFADAFAGGQRIEGDVRYNLRILNIETGEEAYSQSDLTAAGGTDTQQIDFPSNENYRIEVQVVGIIEDGQPIDQTRSGIARGIVVVPEFPAGAVLIAASILGAIIMLQRFSRKGLPFGASLHL